jgi:hypothetical protein
MRNNLLKYPALAPMADAYSQDAAGLVQIIKGMADGVNKSDLKDAYTDSLRIVWAVCCAISGVALLLSLLTESYDIDQTLETNQGLRDPDENNEPTEKDLEASADNAVQKTTPWAY